MSEHVTRCAFRVALAWALGAHIVVMLPTLAFAQDDGPTCDDGRVRWQADLDPIWWPSLREACTRLRAMKNSDQTVRVRIIPDDAEVIVEAIAEDGRTALRRVAKADELHMTLRALVSLPPAQQRRVEESPQVVTAPPASPENPGVRYSEQNMGLEIGASTQLRATSRYYGFAPTGFAQLRLGDWLVGTTLRWEPLQWTTGAKGPGFEMSTLAFGLTVARRFHVSKAVVDFGVSPRLVSETQSVQLPDGEIAGTLTDVSVGAFARATFGSTNTRFFVEADSELMPARLTRELFIDPRLPELPSWSAAIGVGIAWGVQ